MPRLLILMQQYTRTPGVSTLKYYAYNSIPAKLINVEYLMPDIRKFELRVWLMLDKSGETQSLSGNVLC